MSKEELHLLLNDLGQTQFDGLVVAITFLGEGHLFGLGAILLSFHSFRAGLAVAITGLAVLFASALLKHYVFPDFPRPAGFFSENSLRIISGLEMHKNHSFPSGHTMAAFGAFSICAFHIRTIGISWLFAFMALAVGLSRVYLNQHFLVDVVAGAWMGYMLSSAVAAWTRRWGADWLNRSWSNLRSDS